MLMERKPPPTSRPLGDYLNCTEEQIENALSIQSTIPEDEEHRRLGDLLLETGAASLEQLLSAIEAQRIERLKACSLFSALSDEDLAELAAVFQEVTVDTDAQFITQDDHDPSLYVLAKGTCKVFRVDDGDQEIPLARVFPGEPVGEMGYFADGIRSASVRALEEVELLRASYEDLTDCFETVPSVAAAFMEVITERLRKTNLLYQEGQSGGEWEPTLDHLGEFLELARSKELEEGVDRLLIRMVHSASSLMDADRASLFLIDHETGELWSKVAEGTDSKEIRVPSNTGVVGWSVEHNELVNVEEAYEDERFNREVDRKTGYRTRTILCAPVRGHGPRVLGAVQVINKQIGVFTEDDESLLRAFAAQAAVAVDNINLFRQVVRGYRRMAALLDVATVVGQAYDTADLSARVAGRLRDLLQCDRARFYVFAPESFELWNAGLGGEDCTEERFSVVDILAGQVLQSGQAVNIDDVFEDERFNPEMEGKGALQARCVLLAPVLDPHGSPVGVLEAVNRSNGVFDEDDKETLRVIGSQVGVSAHLVS